MLKILSDKLPRILRNKKQLEKELSISISNRGKEIYLEGEGEKEYVAEKVIDAINMGFPISAALSIKKEDLSFEKINIKEHTTKKDFERIRGRIIGKEGATLKTLSDLAGCYLELKDNEVGVICAPEDLKIIEEAIISIIKGAKQGNVYAHITRRREKPITDLGLKEK